MPAETHRNQNSVDTQLLFDLIATLALPHDAPRLDPDERLDEIGVLDESLRWALWDAVVEEFGERGIAEPGDLDDLDDAKTVGELVSVFARWLGWDLPQKPRSPTAS